MKTFPVLNFILELLEMQDPVGQMRGSFWTNEDPGKGSMDHVYAELYPLMLVPPL